MNKSIIAKKYSCLVFGEGGKDKNFLMALIDLEKFKYHTQKWKFNYDNGSGGSPADVLNKCRNATINTSYNLVICFIDLDKLKTDYPPTWKKEKDKLEKKYHNFYISWQVDNLEDELKTVLGNKYVNKHRLNKIAKSKVDKFINSDFWKKILKIIKDREKILDKI